METQELVTGYSSTAPLDIAMTAVDYYGQAVSSTEEPGVSGHFSGKAALVLNVQTLASSSCTIYPQVRRG